MEATYELEPQFLSIQDEERVGGLEEEKDPRVRSIQPILATMCLSLVPFSLKVSAMLGLWYQMYP